MGTVPQGLHGTRLGALAEVELGAGAADGDVLTYVAADGEWRGAQPSGGAGNGLVLLSSGTITEPVAYLDVAVPDNVVTLFITFRGLRSDAASLDRLAAAFSFDGGVSFLNDTVNLDSYFCPALGSSEPLAVLSAIMSDANGFSSDIDFVLTPGSSIVAATLAVERYSSAELNPTFIYWNGDAGAGLMSAAISPSAIVPPTLARVNVLRVLMLGNGDCDPPTSGENLVGGSYLTLGVVQ